MPTHCEIVGAQIKALGLAATALKAKSAQLVAKT
jgi:hypothetical protein